MKSALLAVLIAADAGTSGSGCGSWQASRAGCAFVLGRAPAQQKNDQYGGPFEVKTTVTCGEIVDYCGAKKRCECLGEAGTKSRDGGPKPVDGHTR